jgi:ribosomal RNA-processing protein 36
LTDIAQSEPEESESPDAAATISFGALARAQATFTHPGKSKLHLKKSSASDGWENNEELERKAGRKDHRDFNRSSKHAPTEISSKKAVSRKREVVAVTKREFRDPRFEPLATGSGRGYDAAADESRVRAAYSFLDGYRDDEIKELKIAIKNTKDEDAKEKLKRALMSMESRKRAQERKDKEKEVLAKHRKDEKELVRQGKQPFYLKKAEQKKRLLLDQYGDLKGKQLDRVIERRRKKVEGREKKKMPFARREAQS